MVVKCFWEHNGDDSILYAVDFLGAYTRGKNLDEAKKKIPDEIRSFCLWSGQSLNGEEISVEVAEEKSSDLNICDADSDAIFHSETLPLSDSEYTFLKALALKSAADFLALYQSIPNKDVSRNEERKTFYGAVPRTAKEMYEHTKSVNSYYFEEIGIDCDNEGDILSCRKRGFDLVEKQANFLCNKTFEGSYGEMWSLKKALRRFIWHDRIHAKAMYRMALKTFEGVNIPDIFCFAGIIGK